MVSRRVEHAIMEQLACISSNGTRYYGTVSFSSRMRSWRIVLLPSLFPVEYAVLVSLARLPKLRGAADQLAKLKQSVPEQNTAWN